MCVTLVASYSHNEYSKVHSTAIVLRNIHQAATGFQGMSYSRTEKNLCDVHHVFTEAVDDKVPRPVLQILI